MIQIKTNCFNNAYILESDSSSDVLYLKDLKGRVVGRLYFRSADQNMSLRLEISCGMEITIGDRNFVTEEAKRIFPED